MLEEKVKRAIVDELKRQAENNPGALRVSEKGNKLLVEGEVDLDDLTMVAIGSLSGGP